MPLQSTDALAIGQLASRTGLSISAIRYYESYGLVSSQRNAAGHRRFPRSTIRRLSFILIAQRLGMTLAEIQAALNQLPDHRTPTPEDWASTGTAIRERLDRQIEELTTMRARLDGCIGCGCLSLANCALYNPQDRLAETGSGPRLLLGEDP